MIHGDVSADLLRTIFTPKSPLHDGAVIIRDDRIVAAGTLLPLAETSIQTERFGTRHRAALGITEQTDAIVVVVSEENGQISLVERARIVRNLTEAGLARAIQGMLDPAGGRRRPVRLATRQPAPQRARGDRHGCVSSAASWAGRRRRASPRRPRSATSTPHVADADRQPGPNDRRPAHGRVVTATGLDVDRDHERAPSASPGAEGQAPCIDQDQDPVAADRATTAAIAPIDRPGPPVRRFLRRLFNNWPLKLAAVGLATLMYGGLALSQNTQTLSGPDPGPLRQRTARHGQVAVHPGTGRRRSATSLRATSWSRPARSWPPSTWPATTARSASSRSRSASPAPTPGSPSSASRRNSRRSNSTPSSRATTSRSRSSTAPSRTS